ncbi:hypothetical protein EJB05_20017, partial [Eragrostis curvula]
LGVHRACISTRARASSIPRSEHQPSCVRAAFARSSLRTRPHRTSGNGGGGQGPGVGARRDLILRIVAVIATVGSAIAMGTTNQTLPFFTQFLRFKAQYDDLPTLTYVLQYSFSPDLSLRRCVFVTSMPKARHAMLALVTSAASAAVAIVYLAHKGNARANWFAICQQFDSFCERISASLIGSFVAVALFILLIILSAIALARR